MNSTVPGSTGSAASREARAREAALLARFTANAARNEPPENRRQSAEALDATVHQIQKARARLVAAGMLIIEIDPEQTTRFRLRIASTGQVTRWSAGMREIRVSPIVLPRPPAPVHHRPFFAPAPYIFQLRGADWQPKTCQWIDGPAKARNFCGEHVKPGSSYCPTHHAVCWVRLGKKKTPQPFTFTPRTQGT